MWTLGCGIANVKERRDGTYVSAVKVAELVVLDNLPPLGHLIPHSPIPQLRQAPLNALPLRLPFPPIHLPTRPRPRPPIMLPNIPLPLNLHLHRNLTRINLLPKDPRQEPHREPRLAHPPHVLRREVALSHYAQALAQEREVPRAPLGNAHQVHGGRHPLDDGQRGWADAVRAVEVAAHGVPRAAGDMRDSQPPQRPPRIPPLPQAVENLMREPIPRARNNRIERLNVHIPRNLHALARVPRPHDVDAHPRRLEDGRRLPFPQLLRAAGPRVRVDQDLCAPALLGGAVGPPFEHFGKGARRDPVRGRGECEGEGCRAELRGGCVGVGDAQDIQDNLGPKDVVQGYRGRDGRGACGSLAWIRGAGRATYRPGRGRTSVGAWRAALRWLDGLRRRWARGGRMLTRHDEALVRQAEPRPARHQLVVAARRTADDARRRGRLVAEIVARGHRGRGRCVGWLSCRCVHGSGAGGRVTCAWGWRMERNGLGRDARVPRVVSWRARV